MGQGNWGRWGDEDQRGALNLLTGDVVRAATEAVRQGRVLSLSLPIKGSTSSSVAETVINRMLPRKLTPSQISRMPIISANISMWTR